MKKKIISSFIILFLILVIIQVNQVFSQVAQAPAKDAEKLATEIVSNKKLIPYPNVEDFDNEAVYNIIIDGKKLWDKGEVELALNRFEAALALAPRSQKIQKLVNTARKTALERDKKRIDIEREIKDKEKLQDVEKAYLIDEPSGKKIEETKKEETTPSPLEKKARELIDRVDFTDAQLRDVLEFLSQKTGINIVIDEASVGAAGNATIHLKDVTLIDVLEIVLRAKGLSYRIEENLIWVSTQASMDRESLVTKVYHLSRGLASSTTFTTFDTVTIDNIRGDKERVLAKQEEEEKKEEKKEGGSEYTMSEKRSSEAGGVKTFEGVKVGGSGGVAGTVTMTIKDVLKQNVPWPEGSTIFLDNRTSTLIVRNTPTNIQQIDKIIATLDVVPPQIMIEARFVEVNIDDLKQLGIDWNAEGTLSAAGTYTTFPFKRGKSNKYIDPTPTGYTTTSNFGYGVLDFTEFQTVLRAIEQDTKNNLLSAPKVTTVSGQEAVIKVVKEYRYPTRYDVQTYQAQTGTTTVTYFATVPADFATRDIGIILKVTPTLGADGKTINLTLLPEVSEFDIDRDMYNYGTEDRPYKQPFFTVQKCTANIVIEQGETVVMGGLKKETTAKTVSKVPLLGDIPLLGNMFKHNTDDKTKKNLLIFVTAHILAPSGEKTQTAQDL